MSMYRSAMKSESLPLRRQKLKYLLSGPSERKPVPLGIKSICQARQSDKIPALGRLSQDCKLNPGEEKGKEDEEGEEDK